MKPIIIILFLASAGAAFGDGCDVSSGSSQMKQQIQACMTAANGDPTKESACSSSVAASVDSNCQNSNVTQAQMQQDAANDLKSDPPIDINQWHTDCLAKCNNTCQSECDAALADWNSTNPQ